MRKLTITFLTIVFCLTPSIAFSKTVKPDDLVVRDGIIYKKFTNKPYSGSVEGEDKDGEFHKGTIKNGKREGLWEKYHENGQLKKIGTFKNGKLDGSFERYHENGQY